MKLIPVFVMMAIVCTTSVQSRAECNCPGQWDLNYNDIAMEIGDLVLLINTTVFGYDAPDLVACVCARGDVNCDGSTDILDIVKLLRVITGDIDPSEFCFPDENCSALQCPETVPLTVGSDVFVESKTVPAGTQGVTLGVYLYNDRPLTAIVLPLEFRSITSGSFITGSIQVVASGRLAASALDDELEFLGYDTSRVADAGCGGSAYDSIAYTSNPPLSNPMGALWIGLSQSTDLAAGFDGYPGNGDPSLLFTFDVSNVHGQFEIDTCCWAPAHHIAFVASDFETLIVPQFSKGVFTIGEPLPLGCVCHADPRCDGELDVIDVIGTVSVAFGSAPVTSDASCTVQREDVDCSGVVDILDVLKMINVAFRGFDSQSAFCSP